MMGAAISQLPNYTIPQLPIHQQPGPEARHRSRLQRGTEAPLPPQLLSSLPLPGLAAIAGLEYLAIFQHHVAMLLISECHRDHGL
jgi:hypothetical protein